MADFVQVATIASRLREAMDIRKKKQVDLERETGIYRSAISRYLSGEYEPKNTRIYKLARALDVSDQWLMGYDVPIDRPQTQKNNDIYNDIVAKLNADEEFFSKVKALYLFDSAPEGVVPENVKTLVEFARTVPEDKASMILQVMKSIVEAD